MKTASKWKNGQKAVQQYYSAVECPECLRWCFYGRSTLAEGCEAFCYHCRQWFLVGTDTGPVPTSIQKEFKEFIGE